MKLILNGILFLIGYYSYNFGMIESFVSTKKRTFSEIVPQNCDNSFYTLESLVSDFEDFSLKKRFYSRLSRDFEGEEQLNLDSKMAQIQNIPVLLQQIFVPYSESQKKISLVLKNK